MKICKKAKRLYRRRGWWPSVIYFWGDHSVFEQLKRPVSKEEAAKLFQGEIGQIDGRVRFITD